MNKRGIILIATGSNIYIKMAFNLACSLRKMGSKIPVCLVHDKSIDELSEFRQFQFSHKIRVTSEQSDNPFLLKLYINELSPFDETIYLDVDMLWMPFKGVNDLFESLKDVDFTIANRGRFEGKSNDWMKTVGKEKWVDVASEFIYFKKTAKNDVLFNEARVFYLTNDEIKRTIGGYQPDEPAISYAMNELEITPHVMPFHPSYWEPHGYAHEMKIKKDYYLLSMGGSHVGGRIRRIYNSLVIYYAKEIGAGYFEHINKDTLKERVAV